MVPTPLPATLAQSNFTVGGQLAPLFFAMPGQVNVQIPWSMAGQTQAAVVDTVNGVASNSQTVQIVPFAPGIFTINATGAGQGAVLIAPTAQLADARHIRAARGAYSSHLLHRHGSGVHNQPATGVAAGSTFRFRTHLHCRQ